MLAHQHGGNFNIFQLKKSPNSHSFYLFILFLLQLCCNNISGYKKKLKLQVRAFELRFFQAEFYDVSGGVFRGQSLAERNGNVVGKTRSKFLAQDVAAGGVAARGGPDLL